ncbi:hypothetical protein LQW54_008892 [Pestalotiopsis sp. IQ-011]
MLRPIQRGAPISLQLPDDKSITAQSWRNHVYTGLETPPSEVSTLHLDKLQAFVNSKLEDLSATSHGLDSHSYDGIKPTDDPTVAVIGVGYVGTHLVSTFATKYPVIGFDVSQFRVNELLREQSQMAAFAKLLTDIEYTYDPAALRRATHFLISVPTLLRHNSTVDASYISKALQTVMKYARPGATIVIESSVAVGMTRELLGPVATQCGFFAGMSPEVSIPTAFHVSSLSNLNPQRVDPGRVEPPVSSIPKIVSGLEDIRPGSLDSIVRIYSTVFDTVVPVSSPEVAEMTKLYENCQRMMCIAYANEMADACVVKGIDPYEVCRAAATKPFGYMNYTPGIGVGGHCIPVNPFYLLSNSSFPLLEQCTKSMNARPRRIALQILEDLQLRASSNGFSHRKPRVLAVGMGFKKGQSVLSNSPGLEMLKALHISGEVQVSWADSLVSQSAIFSIPRLEDKQWNSVDLGHFDLVLVVFLQADMDSKVLDLLPSHTEVKFLGCKDINQQICGYDRRRLRDSVVRGADFHDVSTDKVKPLQPFEEPFQFS